MLKSSKKAHKHEDLKKVPEIRKDKKSRLRDIRDNESRRDIWFEEDDLNYEDEEC